MIPNKGTTSSSSKVSTRRKRISTDSDINLTSFSFGDMQQVHKALDKLRNRSRFWCSKACLIHASNADIYRGNDFTKHYRRFRNSKQCIHGEQPSDYSCKFSQTFLVAWIPLDASIKSDVQKKTVTWCILTTRWGGFPMKYST